MELDVVSYTDLLDANNTVARAALEAALLNKGIVGISHVPEFERKAQAFIAAARQFAALEDSVKQQYAPDLKTDEADIKGYDIGVMIVIIHVISHDLVP